MCEHPQIRTHDGFSPRAGDPGGLAHGPLSVGQWEVPCEGLEGTPETRDGRCLPTRMEVSTTWVSVPVHTC